MKINILIDRFTSKDYSIEKKRSLVKIIISFLLMEKKLSPNLQILSKIDGILAWHENSFDKNILDKLKNVRLLLEFLSFF